MNIWRHKKTGGLYTVLADDLRIEATNQRGVLYQSLIDQKKWVRPYGEFYDGRFESLAGYINHDDETTLRFTAPF
ncbi:MAG: hypothetical protein Tp138OMZ00d2C19078261_41 [Prokaryotic dsDNA virus sp.]|nr:MAG: hypothetical protein Tp138OMZ00d2C19078261_41 [Prokaryotic dsDNA virus sp.]